MSALRQRRHDPRDVLLAGVRQYLAELSDDEFAEIVYEVRSSGPAHVASSKRKD